MEKKLLLNNLQKSVGNFYFFQFFCGPIFTTAYYK